MSRKGSKRRQRKALEFQRRSQIMSRIRGAEQSCPLGGFDGDYLHDIYHAELSRHSLEDLLFLHGCNRNWMAKKVTAIGMFKKLLETVIAEKSLLG